MTNRNNLFSNFKSIIIWTIASAIGATWRIKINRPENLDPFNDLGCGRIYCFWHSQLLPLSFIFRNTGKTALVSKSRDGQIAAAVARYWKHDIVFGSSGSNRISALRQCVRVLNEKKCVVITPDGPRGPARKIKSGVAQIALLSGAQVVPVAVAADRAWRLKSWDKFLIPKPFSRLKVFLGDPVDPGQFLENECDTEKLRTIIQERMDQLGDLA